MENRIIVIDDELDFLESVRRGFLTHRLNNVFLEADSRKAASLFEQGKKFDVALIDITMPGLNGVELLELIKSTSPETECIMVTALNEARIAVQCLKKGAYDYLVKPISRDDLVSTTNRALEKKRLFDILDLAKSKSPPGLTNKKAFKSIVTGSAEVLKILKEAELHAASNVPVLITGESGTGKELLARAIHDASPRAKYAFTPVNMASLGSTLFDSEFFGHTKGAFTGAERDRAGYLENSHRGTLFLDEIGNLPIALQGKLLRTLQEGEFIKLGTSSPRKVDVRFIAATNADLDRLVASRKFRKDLYYRLKGAWLSLPPLRERKGDIPLLVRAFLKDLCGSQEKCRVDERVFSMLMDYEYPGNIRELKSILHSAVNLAQGRTITTHFLPSYLQRKAKKFNPRNKPESKDIRPLAEVEKEHILRAYAHTGKNKSRTATLLGIGLNTLRRKLAAYGQG